MSRLNRIYTRSGDQGMTGLGDGSRCSKHSARIEAIGDVDELNSLIGLLRSRLPGEAKRSASADKLLLTVQQRLFDLGGELAIPGSAVMRDDRVDELESAIDDLNADLPPLENFVLHGGSEPVALAHVARAVCRRAERRLAELRDQAEINPVSLQYLNRLSDYLFVLARTLGRESGAAELLWQQSD